MTRGRRTATKSVEEDPLLSESNNGDSEMHAENVSIGEPPNSRLVTTGHCDTTRVPGTLWPVPPNNGKNEADSEQQGRQMFQHGAREVEGSGLVVEPVNTSSSLLECGQPTTYLSIRKDSASDMQGFLHHLVESFTQGHSGCPAHYCAGCYVPIKEAYFMRIGDFTFHEQCVCCATCTTPLDKSCFLKEGQLYCRDDYQRLLAVRCARCQVTISQSELVMKTSSDLIFHEHCFVCTICGQLLQRGDQYALRNGHIICGFDYVKEWQVLMSITNTEGSDMFMFDDMLYDEDVDLSKGPKRPRTILNTVQRRKFKASFEINPKPCRKVREALANETGLTVRVVQVWFQNQRAKVKKLARRQSGSDDKSRTGPGAGAKRQRRASSVVDSDTEDAIEAEGHDDTLNTSTSSDADVSTTRSSPAAEPSKEVARMRSLRASRSADTTDVGPNSSDHCQPRRTHRHQTGNNHQNNDGYIRNIAEPASDDRGLLIGAGTEDRLPPCTDGAQERSERNHSQHVSRILPFISELQDDVAAASNVIAAHANSSPQHITAAFNNTNNSLTTYPPRPPIVVEPSMPSLEELSVGLTLAAVSCADQNILTHPIDQLYTMQDSYFAAHQASRLAAVPVTTSM